MVYIAAFVGSLLLQSPLPAIDPSSVYGMKTYTTNPSFGFLPDKFAVGFAPADIDRLTMHVLKGSEPKAEGGFYATDTPYPAFKMLRFQPMPTIELAEPGEYVIEFRYGGAAVTRLPFRIEKKQTGDEFNPVVSWEFHTPVDKAGNLTFSNADDGQVWLNAWLAPAREGIAMRSSATIRLSHGGKVVAEALPFMFQEPQNARRGFKLFKPGGRTPFKKSDLAGLSGAVTGTISLPAKTLRTFAWTVNGGKVQPHPRSASDHSPRTDYWIPRRLAGSAEGYQFFHLEEQYWAISN
ncbi:MAG: hypothetical protein IT363_12820 [Methanoregulaceae archaeon]|nr:hypothetical protein [Methanoregulaceae archaeon]